MFLLRLLSPELAHRLAIFALRTGLWRVGLVISALLTLAWSTPCVVLLYISRAIRARL